MKKLLLSFLLCSSLAFGQGLKGGKPTNFVIKEPCSNTWVTPTWTDEYPLCPEAYPTLTDPGCIVLKENAKIPDERTVQAIQHAVVAYFQYQLAIGNLWQSKCAPMDIPYGCTEPVWYDYFPEVRYVQGWSICTNCGVGGQPLGQSCFAGMTVFWPKPYKVIISTCEPNRTIPLIIWETSNFVVGHYKLCDGTPGDWTRCNLFDGPWIGRAVDAVKTMMETQ